ncbi:MAG: protein-disulfide reductase DsbD [Gammaproteobacteria bacterium]|nr:MAG: protein-disulfide reductase DsbD [Gammaproteobacteria bacterium]
MKHILQSLTLLLLGLAAWAAAHAEDELLPPKQAFALEARMTAPDRVEATWKIADDYYLYRKNFHFESKTPVVEIGTPDMPPGDTKNDEFFGKIQVFHKQVTIGLPLKGTLEPGQEVHFKFIAQGCNEKVGVCYPPEPYDVTLKVPAGAGAQGPGESAGPLAALKSLASQVAGSDDELLPPDQAFVFSLEVAAEDRLRAHWDIAPGYYLYRDKLRFSLRDSPGNRLGPINLPPAKTKHDELFGDTPVYVHELDIDLPLIRDPDASDRITLVAEYQGCNEPRGVCYPPVRKEIAFSLAQRLGKPDAVEQELIEAAETARAGTQGTAPSAPAATPASATEDTGNLSEQDRLARELASGNTLVTLLIFFGLGLLLTFTPCVLPMMPILSGIIVGQGQKLSTGRAFALSLAYVLAMALTYTIAGVLAGLFGANLQAWFQNPWVLGVFAGIFVLLALSMFGFFELQMPSSIQSKLSEASAHQKGGSLTGAAIMGFLSALIVGPCVTAPLMGALIYIGQTGDPVLGGAALFSLSMGMGTPLLLLGTSAGSLLPKPGPWMDTVKAVFGVLMLGVALWLLERVLPGDLIFLLWGVLLVVSAVYMGALEPVREGASGWYRLWKGLGVVLLLWGAFYLVAAARGGHDLLQPLRQARVAAVAPGAAPAENQALKFRRIKGIQGLEAALEEARKAGQPVMLDFYADWCVSCKEMEKYTFHDPRVIAASKGMLLLQADVTPNDEQDRALLKRFGLIGPPAILFFDRNGNEQRNLRVVGYMPPEQFVKHLQQIKGVKGDE